MSDKISIICNTNEKQQNLLATDQQAFKGELTKEVAKKVECGVPSEIKNENKNEPPGLSWGGDDRGLGRKGDPSIETSEDKELKEKCLPKETDSHTNEKVKIEEAVNPYLRNQEEWMQHYDLYPEAMNWNEPAKNNWAVPKSKGKGQGLKGETYLRTDPGGLVFEPSDWAPKPSERSPVGSMPLLSEFIRCKMGKRSKKMEKSSV